MMIATEKTFIATTLRKPPSDWNGEADAALLDFDPDGAAPKPDAMEQHDSQYETFALLRAHLREFGKRNNIFVDCDSFICYDQRNLNVRVSPDVYVAFGVDSAEIRRTRLYMPWRVGKPPDWALEVASHSTWRGDVGRKMRIYERIGVPELFHFDPTGGDYYGYALAGFRLEDGRYVRLEDTREPDGILKVYASELRLSLCWEGGMPQLYDPRTGSYLMDWEATESERIEAIAARESERSARLFAEAAWDSERIERLAAQSGWDAERMERLAAESARDAEGYARLSAEAEAARLREQLRRLLGH